jgi:hypothetical protein
VLVRLSRRSRLISATRPLAFLLAWAFLDCLFNLRYPGTEATAWYVLPSIDATVLLAGLVFAHRRGYQISRGLRFALVAFAVVARIFRAAEGVVDSHFHRPLSLYLDIPLVPNLVSLLRSTVPLSRLLVWAALIAIAIVVLAVVTWWVVGAADRSLASPGAQRLFFAVLALCLLLSPLWRQRRDPHLHYGLFGKSVVGRFVQEIGFLFHARAYRRQRTEAIAHVQDQLRGLPRSLDRLHHADVLLFFIESYGQTVIDNPAYARRMAPAYDAFERELGARGFALASSLLSSPTYAGRSWLAHGTFATGVRVEDGLAYTVLLETQPPPLTMAEVFRGNGYRTVLVQPGTTQRWPEGEVHGFDEKYYAMDLDYHGPAYKWATMPDQYVVDFVDRREVARQRRQARPPLFVEYALVSSHSPWSLQPRFVPAWQSLGDGGRIFAGQAPVRFPITWSNLEDGGEAYVTSLRYDFEMLRSYISERVADDALIILLGDHQPSAEITDHSASYGVPIHFISRDRSLIQRVVDAGYVPGMHASVLRPALPMERFLPWFLERFSSAPAAAP